MDALMIRASILADCAKKIIQHNYDERIVIAKSNISINNVKTPLQSINTPYSAINETYANNFIKNLDNSFDFSKSGSKTNNYSDASGTKNNNNNGIIINENKQANDKEVVTVNSNASNEKTISEEQLRNNIKSSINISRSLSTTRSDRSMNHKDNSLKKSSVLLMHEQKKQIFRQQLNKTPKSSNYKRLLIPIPHGKYIRQSKKQTTD